MENNSRKLSKFLKIAPIIPNPINECKLIMPDGSVVMIPIL